MNRKIMMLSLWLCLIICVLSGCLPLDDNQTSVELTQEQKAAIELFVQNRDEWAETLSGVKHYPVNSVHVYETDQYTMLTVAHVEYSSVTGGYGFVGVRGYLVMDGKFSSAGDYHYKDWFSECTTVELDELSDEQLYEVLEESYINYLSQQ